MLEKSVRNICSRLRHCRGVEYVELQIDPKKSVPKIKPCCARFTRPSQFKRYEEAYRPWAIKVGTKSRFLLNVYYEMRWEQDIHDLRREMRIPTVNKPKDS